MSITSKPTECNRIKLFLHIKVKRRTIYFNYDNFSVKKIKDLNFAKPWKQKAYFKIPNDR